MPVPATNSDPPRRALQCNACGRWVPCSVEELLRYTREGWPRCCEQVMAFFTEPSRPAASAPPASSS